MKLRSGLCTCPQINQTIQDRKLQRTYASAGDVKYAPSEIITEMILSNPYPALPIGDYPCQAVNITTQIPHSIIMSLVVILCPVGTNQIDPSLGVISDFQGDGIVLELEVGDCEACWLRASWERVGGLDFLEGRCACCEFLSEF